MHPARATTPRVDLIAIAVLISVLLTSILSGVVGMAGGMVLMAILATLFPVASAMILHGAVQALSNGARFWFLREHMAWRIVPPYAAGAGAVVLVFSFATFVPDAAIVLILIGSFPWLGRAVPKLRGLDVTRRLTGVACGVSVTTAQLLAGASGPLLDVFYLNSDLNRYQVIANKAFTQTIGHIIKLGYYGTLLSIGAGGLANGLDGNLTWWLVLGAMATATLGARIGTSLLHRVNEVQFRRITGWIVLALGALCMFKGAVDLVLR